MLPMWKGKRNLTKGEWTRKALYQVGLVSGHSRNQVKRGSPDFSTSQCREHAEFHIWLTISKLCASWIFLIDFKSFSVGHVFLLQAFSLVLLTASVTVFLWLDHYLAGTKIQEKVSISKMGQKWFFNKCFSWTGPGLCSSRLPPLPLPFFPLALRFFGNFCSHFFVFRCGNFAIKFLFPVWKICSQVFRFPFWNFCFQVFIFYFENFALRVSFSILKVLLSGFFIFHFENLALLFSFSTFTAFKTLLSSFHLLFLSWD